MTTQEWPAHDYAIGSFIQATIANDYLKYLKINATDSVLDIGCGNGAFSRNILDKIPNGNFLGIDGSENMLKLARQEIAQHHNATVQKTDVLTMAFTNKFDYIVSFWCLQWCAFAIEKAFLNIHNALKNKGKALIIIPAGDDSFINIFYQIQKSGKFACLNNFKPPIEYEHFLNLEEKIRALPFKMLKFEKLKHQILLPSLDIYRKFIKGLAFFQDQISNDEINIVNEALVNAYQQECQEKYNGEYWFNLSLYLIQCEK